MCIRDLSKVLKLGSPKHPSHENLSKMKLGEAFIQANAKKHQHVFINEERRKLLNFSIKISLCVLHVGQTYCETIYLRREQKGAG